MCVGGSLRTLFLFGQFKWILIKYRILIMERKKIHLKDAWATDGVPEIGSVVVVLVKCGDSGNGYMVVKYDKFGWWQQAFTPCTWCALSYDVLRWRYFD